MQLKIWLDDSNHLTFSLKLSSAVSGGYTDGPEVIAAVVSDSQLSNISEDQLIDLLGQTIDFLTTDQQSTGPEPDWRTEFLAATDQSK